MESEGLLTKKWFFWALFIFLFAYAIVRAWTVVPILDELATFYSYIQTGHYFNSIELVDANNHVLNSFFGHQFYRVFGDHFFLFRIASLLSFPVYFFALKYICQISISKKINVVVFISLVSIPWIFEYFSYARGYAMAIAFFFAAIAFIIKWKRSQKLIHFALILVSLFLAVASSLTYLMPSVLLFLYPVLLLILNWKGFRQNALRLVGLILIWIAALAPFVRYSFELKAADALWWGNQDGLWDSTGSSLSRLVLFTDSIWVFYAACFLLLIGIVFFFISWKEKGLWTYIKETEAMIFLLLIGSLTGIVLMRYVFDVNYPMDRVGMFLVPLFILFLGLFLSKYRVSRYALFGLCFFPLSFLYHLNISTSIFSPEDRIPIYLSTQIKSEITDETALSAEHVSHLSYAYSCRNDARIHIAFTAEKEAEYLGDYHINWLGRVPINGYDVIAQDEESRTRFMKRTKDATRRLIGDTLIQKMNTSEMYFGLFKQTIDSALNSKRIQCEISGKMDFDQTTNEFNIIETIEDQDNNRTTTSSPSFSWYFSDRTDINFTFVDRPIQLSPADKTINVFFMNSDLRKIKVEYIRIRIYEITD